MKTLLLILSLCLYAFTASAHPLQDKNNTVLWGVIVNGDTSYLFGTFRQFGQTFVTKFAGLKDKVKNTDCLVMETNLDETYDLLSDKTYTAREDWINQLSKHERTALNKFLHSRNVSNTVEDFAKLSPNMLWHMIENLVYSDQCVIWGKEDTQPMENYLFYLAKYYYKQTIGFEPVKDAIAAAEKMEDMTDTDAIDTLKDFANNKQKYYNKVRNCNDATNYRFLDINYNFSEPSTDIDSAYASLLDERNEKWANQLTDMLGKKKIFVAVGLKHLYYKKGLIELLLQKGYKVVPLDMWDL